MSDTDHIKQATSRLLPSTNPNITSTSWPPLRLALVAILLSLGSSFNFGFQLLITNPAQGAFIEFLNHSKSLNNRESIEDLKLLENEWSIIVASLFLGSVIGAFLIRIVAEKLGRKYGFMLSVGVQLISCFIAILSYMITNHYLFTFSRILMGTSITTSMGISAIFVTEASPSYCRGVTSLINGVFLQFSLSVGAIMAMPRLLGTVHSWYMLYIFQACTTSIVLVFLPFIHESPGYLASHGNKKKTTESVQFYHSISKTSAELMSSRLIESHRTGDGMKKSLLSVWRNSFGRHGTLLGMLVNFSMAMTGITVINAFAFEILLNTGMEKHEASIANVFVCLFSLAGIFVSTRIIDHHGRRPLLLSTFGALAIINIAIVGLMFTHKYTETLLVGYILVAAICLFNFVFAMGPGPVSLFLSGELVPQSFRSASTTWANAVMATARFMVLSCYLPLKNLTSEYTAYALFFIAPMILAVIVLYCTLPETKGKSAEEIKEAYEHKKLLTTH